MKTFRKIISSFFLIIASLVALVFAFVELRALFAGDFLLMNSVGAAFVAYLSRGLFFVILSGYAICILVSILKYNGVAPSHYVVAPTIVIASIFTVFFYTQWIYWVVILLALIPCISIYSRKPVIK